MLSNNTKNTRPADGEGDINDEEMIDSDADENVKELAKILDNTHLKIMYPSYSLDLCQYSL